MAEKYGNCVIVTPRAEAYRVAKEFYKRGYRWSLNYSPVFSRPEGLGWNSPGMAWIVTTSGRLDA